VGLSYNADGDLSGEMRYNGLPGTGYVGATSLLYDAADNVTSIVEKNASATVLASYLYSYNAATELSQETDNGTLITYAYDPAGQLTATSSTSYAYDANGNPDNTGDVIGTDNELMSNGVWSYTYDASGNLTEKVNISTGETWTYKYDNGNDLIQAVDTTMSGTTTSLYDYDVFGNRIEEQVVTSSTTTTTKYVLDSWNPATAGGTGNSGTEVWADLTSSNTLQTVYLRGDVVDQLFGRISSGGVGAFTLLDHLQSVVGVTNASGTLEDVITYDAYGNFTESSPGMVGAYTYAGMEYDSTTQLYYSRARYYDATTGRWISQDPLGFDAGDSNLYRYVNNAPTNETDPSGEIANPPEIFTDSADVAQVTYKLGYNTVSSGFGPIPDPNGGTVNLWNWKINWTPPNLEGFLVQEVQFSNVFIGLPKNNNGSNRVESAWSSDPTYYELWYVQASAQQGGTPTVWPGYIMSGNAPKNGGVDVFAIDPSFILSYREKASDYTIAIASTTITATAKFIPLVELLASGSADAILSWQINPNSQARFLPSSTTAPALWGQIVPVRIVVAYFAELRVYGFWGVKERFAELLRILEEVWATQCGR
jgi:RHS repeat-associated protein